mgnify:CR=1 FL=1
MDYCYVFGELVEGEWFKTWDSHGVRIKIGSTSNPNQRLTSLRTTWPEGQWLKVWWTGGGSGLTLERELQSYYKPARIRGEFFELPGYELLWMFSKEYCYFFNNPCPVDWYRLKETHWREKWEGSGFFLNLLCDELFAERGYLPPNTKL